MTHALIWERAGVLAVSLLLHCSRTIKDTFLDMFFFFLLLLFNNVTLGKSNSSYHYTSWFL